MLHVTGAHVPEHPVVVEPVAQYDTKGSRLTCVAMGDGELVADVQRVGKRKRDEESDGEVDDFLSEVEAGEGGSADEEGETDKNNGEQDSD